MAGPPDLLASPERCYLQRVLHGLRGLRGARDDLDGRGLGHDDCWLVRAARGAREGLGLVEGFYDRGVAAQRRHTFLYYKVVLRRDVWLRKANSECF